MRQVFFSKFSFKVNFVNIKGYKTSNSLTAFYLYEPIPTFWSLIKGEIIYDFSLNIVYKYPLQRVTTLNNSNTKSPSWSKISSYLLSYHGKRRRLSSFATPAKSKYLDIMLCECGMLKYKKIKKISYKFPGNLPNSGNELVVLEIITLDFIWFE